MEGQDIRGLMEAYSQVHETPEVLNEEVEQIDEGGAGPRVTGPNTPGARYFRNQASQEKTAQKAQTGTIQTNQGLGGIGATQEKFKRTAQGNLQLTTKNTENLLGKGALDKSITYGGQKYDRLTQGNNVSYVKRAGQTGPSYAERMASKLSGTPKPKSPTAGTPPRPATAPTGGSGTPTAAAKPSSVVLAKQGGVEGKLDKATGKFTAGGFTGAEKTRYTQYSPKPAAAAPTTPAPGTKAAGPESIKPKTPNPLMQKTFGYQTGNAPDQVAKASQNVSKETSDKAFAKSKEMVKNIKPSADLKMDLDIFDLVKGHLLDEGYAETEQNALVMMANMSEEWRQSILEAHGVQLDEAEIMKHQQERDRIEADKAHEADRVKKARSAYGKLSRYSPPTKGKHGEIERRQAQRPPSKLRSGSLPEEYIDEEETLTEKLAKGTKGVSFSTGRHQGGFEQAMTEKNPRTGRQRKTSPEMKAIGAHSKAKSAQWKAEHEGDHEAAAKHKERRDKIAHTVYNKTRRIIDRADND